MGAAHSIPVTPKAIESRMTPGTRKTTSLDRERTVAFTGFPIDCRKILLAFCTQQSRMPPRKIRKHIFAYSLYRPLSLPNRLTMTCGQNSKSSVAMMPITALAAMIWRYVSKTRLKLPAP